jgi:3'-phosphoadenosine 5'-phosphosulfate sulfotransferase (PAPS reductase)/FAD synthetase
MNQLLEQSQEIVNQAIADYSPYAIVAMVSGGNDSMLAYQVAKNLNVPIHFMMHGNTRTGIKATTEFVRQFASDEALPYIEADAGSAYEDYVLRKGFFGRGRTAHSFAYHTLKAGPFRKAISRHIRQRQRNRRVLFLNGARAEESKNRAQNMEHPVRVDSGAPMNVWVNICHHWEKSDRDEFLSECKAPCNPVTKELCRSGECLCGTSQNHETKVEASVYDPNWGAWIDDLERRVFEAGHGWGWGEETTSTSPAFLERAGQITLFQPMCVSCKVD